MTHDQNGQAALTTEGLHLALSTLRSKWRRPGAEFTGDVDVQPDRVTQAFTFDDQPYEVTVFADQTLQVREVDDTRKKEVSIPRGLALPKEFRRTDAYQRAQSSDGYSGRRRRA